MKKNPLVTKYSGEQEPFDPAKLEKSLSRAGAGRETIEHVVNHVKEILEEGISTQKIYKEAFRELKKQSFKPAGRYSLKEAIMELGPSGYPFERYIGEILNRAGFETEIGPVIEGRCVRHEIDVIAQNGNTYYMVECKYHNTVTHTCDVKVPLYIHSRFRDIIEKWRSLPGHEHKEHQGWVVTNTRFTSDAIQYGECAGLKMLSWDYPKNESLRAQIGRYNIYPFTVLSSLTKAEKKQLLELGVILCSDICDDREVLQRADIPRKKHSRIVKEAKAICAYPNLHP